MNRSYGFNGLPIDYWLFLLLWGYRNGDWLLSSSDATLLFTDPGSHSLGTEKIIASTAHNIHNDLYITRYNTHGIKLAVTVYSVGIFSFLDFFSFSSQFSRQRGRGGRLRKGTLTHRIIRGGWNEWEHRGKGHWRGRSLCWHSSSTHVCHCIKVTGTWTFVFLLFSFKPCNQPIHI